MKPTAFLAAVLPPVVVMVIAHVLLQLLSFTPVAEREVTLTVILTVIRIVVIGWSGWRLVSVASGSIWLTLLGGPLILLIDHVVIKGASFLFVFQMPFKWRAQSVLGVVISYVMFLPLGSTVSLAGGLLGRWKRPPSEAAV